MIIKHYSFKIAILSILLAAITIIAFWQVKNAGFVFYDDINYVAENPYVKAGLTAASIHWAFTSILHSMWHPVTWLSFMLDTDIYGFNPAGYHITNLLFHLLNTLLLFFILFKMTGALWKSFFVALFFSIHPLRVESVAWITERKDVLSAFFMFLSLWTYIDYVKKKAGVKHWLLIILFFILGLMSKMIAVTFPFLLLFLDYWPLQRLDFKAVTEKAGLFTLAFLFCIVNVVTFHQSGGLGQVAGLSFSIRFENALISYCEYLVKMLFPFHLAVLKFYQPMPWWKVTASVLALIGISVFAIRNFRKRPYLFMGWLWYLGALLPVIGLIQFTLPRISDRFTYIPSIGILIAVIWGMADLVSHFRYSKPAVTAAVLGFAIFFLTLTRIQVGYWKNTIELFAQAIRVTDSHYLLFNNIGNELAEEGRYKDALDHYAAIIKVKPDFAPAYFNMAKTLEKMEKRAEALKLYEMVLELDPHNAQAQESISSLKKI